jgi:hypothetical protein
LFAQATVTPVSVDYDKQEVKFRVTWNNATAANNRVWVWVDICSAPGVSPATFVKADIGGASVTSGSIAEKNTRGFYVNATPTTVTVKLENAAGKFNWCAYGSDYPPNAKDDDSGGYTLRGAPPFVITTSSGTATVTTNTYSGGTITALTDATGCPGVLCGKNGESAGLLNCCVTGTTNCSGTCTTNRTYTTNDGTCSGNCNKAYVEQYDQCDSLMNAKYAEYANNGCYISCGATCAGCASLCASYTYAYYWTNDKWCGCSPCVLNGGCYYHAYLWQAGKWVDQGSWHMSNASAPVSACK